MKNQEIKNDSPRDQKGLTEVEFLAAYDPAKYERPSVTVDTLIFTVRELKENNYRKLPEKTLSLLLIQRGEHPHIGKWALPGGFVAMEENLETAALRELEEETGLKDIYLEQLYTWGDVGRDLRTRVISTSYMALVDSSSLLPKAADDAAKAAWFSAELKLLEEKKEKQVNGYILKQTYKLILNGGQEIMTAGYEVTKTIGKGTIRTERRLTDSEGLAFDHGKIIAYAIERLRSKVLYTDIAFHLMPEYFTLTELQQVYEVLLDKELLKANFRRKIADMVLETEQYRTDAGHRPSKLYQYNSF